MTSPVAYWHVPDIEAKLAEVTAAGATVKDPAADVGGGRLVATFTTPMATSSGCFRTDDGAPRRRRRHDEHGPRGRTRTRQPRTPPTVTI